MKTKQTKIITKFKKFIFKPSDTIFKFLRHLSSQESRYQFGIILDDNRKFLSTLTDADVRRALIKGFTVKDAVKVVVIEDLNWS